MGKKSRRKSGRPPQRTPVSRPTTPPASRAHVADILRRANAGEELSGEDAEMARAIQQHPEYHAFFALGAEAPDELDGMSPWAHVSMHTIVERQRHLLPDVEAALTRLQRRGLTEHEAQHRVAEILSQHIWSMLHDRVPFNEAEYLQQIRAL
jgi:uncharacterized protein DUF1841